MMKYPIILVLLALLSACVKPFQPPKPDYEMWSKPGVDELGVKKALLECGDPAPSSTQASYRHAFKLNTFDEIMNYVFLVGLCMERSGFTYRDETIEESCNWYPRYKNYAACQPNPKIPEPSVERRLNSEYCKRRRSYDYCVKTALNPKGCKYNNYVNIAPECLP